MVRDQKHFEIINNKKLFNFNRLANKINWSYV